MLKGVSETIQNDANEQNGGFLSMLLGTLSASLLGNILAGKGVNRAGEGAIRTGYGNKKGQKNKINFEIQKCYQHEARFNGVYSRDNLSRIKDGAYIINLDEYSDTGTHWVALYVGGASPKDVKNNDVTYFNSFGVEHVPKEITKFISNKNIKANIFRIQEYDSIICGYFCIGFINFMLAGKTSTEFTNLFSPNNFKRNDDIILNYFVINV